MQMIMVDADAQTEWSAQVTKAHSQVRLSVIDAAGKKHSLIDLWPGGADYSKFEGASKASFLQLQLPKKRRQTTWLLNLSVTDALHLRIDARGQLEVWSGAIPVAKLFDEYARSDEWPTDLIIAECSSAFSLSALLAGPGAVTLKSLDLGGLVSLTDVSALKGLSQLENLDLNSCEQLTDLAPLAGLSQLTSLDLSWCTLTDLAPLAGLSQLTSLNLNSCNQLTDLAPLAGLSQLTSLNLGWSRDRSWCKLTDLTPLAGLSQLTWLDLGGCRQLRDFAPLADLSQLTLLDLSSCVQLTDLMPLAGLSQLTWLDLGRCRQLSDPAPLAGLSQLTSLGLSSWDHLTDLTPLAGLSQLTSLNLSLCNDLTDLRPLAGLSQLTSLDLSSCEQLTDLKPLVGMTQLTSLDLGGCVQLTDLASLANLPQLTSLRLNFCWQLTDLAQLASMTQLTSLYLNSCGQLTDLSPLAGMTQLTSLDLGGCVELTDLSPLAGMTQLTSLDLSGCNRLVSVGLISSLPRLTDLDLAECANIRDADSLDQSPAIRKLIYDETATRDSILLACAMRRGDADLADRTVTLAGSFELSKVPELHARRLVEAVQKLATQDTNLTETFTAVATAFRRRGEVPGKTWESFLATVICAPGTAAYPAFEATLADLPLNETERVLGPALLALADAPSTARDWALALVQQALRPLVASARHARDVAPAAAVFFHAQGLTQEVERWMDLGSVAQLPEWRDRVLIALMHRAMKAGELLEARRLFNLLQTPERRDEARADLVQHLAALAQFTTAAAELDAIVDRARRASTASQVLAQVPSFAGEPNAGLSLLLALDGDPDTLADVLATMAQQAPDSPLVQHLAAVFAPSQGIDVGAAMAALLDHTVVADLVAGRQRKALRDRLSADPRLSHTVMARGMAAQLHAEGLVDGPGAAEVATALMASAP